MVGKDEKLDEERQRGDDGGRPRAEQPTPGFARRLAALSLAPPFTASTPSAPAFRNSPFNA